MQPNDHLKKIVKILIFAFLCTEMQTKFTHDDLTQQFGIGRLATDLAETTTHASEQAAAYQASIRLLSEEKQHFGKGHICSGALIARSVVLTVAHCLQHYDRQTSYHPAELRVILGSSQRFAPGAHTQAFGVTHVYRCPAGLALLMLDRDVPAEQPHIRSIALPELNSTPVQAADNIWQVTSWGTDAAGRELHDLLALNASQVACEQPQQICVTYQAVGYSAQVRHDAGAPLLQQSHLLGLQAAEGRFIDVAPHVNWIQQQIGDGSNQNSAIWGILGFLVFSAYVLRCSGKSQLH